MLQGCGELYVIGMRSKLYATGVLRSLCHMDAVSFMLQGCGELYVTGVRLTLCYRGAVIFFVTGVR